MHTLKVFTTTPTNGQIRHPRSCVYTIKRYATNMNSEQDRHQVYVFTFQLSLKYSFFFFFKEYYIHKEQFFLTQVVVVRFPGATGHCGGYLWSCSLNYTQGYVKRWLGPRSLRLARVTQQYFIERGGGEEGRERLRLGFPDALNTSWSFKKWFWLPNLLCTGWRFPTKAHTCHGSEKMLKVQ